LVEILIEIEDCINNHLGEELLILGDNLGVEGSLSALDQKISLLKITLVSNFDGDFSDSLKALSAGLSITLDDDLGVHALLDEGLSLFEELTGGDNDRCGTISDFIVLRLGNIDEGLGSWMNDIKEANKSSAII